MLRNEYLLRDPREFQETILHRISMLSAQKEIVFHKDAATKSSHITLN